MAIINQKEYLKKYLSIGSEPGKKKKRKKKPTNVINHRVKVIDDDIDVINVNSAADMDELFGTNEDAPQIVGVIDDRPLHLKVDDYRRSDLWKPVGSHYSLYKPSNDETTIDKSTTSATSCRSLERDSDPPRYRKHASKTMDYSSPRKRDEDNLLQQRENGSGNSSVRRQPAENLARTCPDTSPARRRPYNSPARKRPDDSPARRRPDNSPASRLPDNSAERERAGSSPAREHPGCQLQRRPDNSPPRNSKYILGRKREGSPVRGDIETRSGKRDSRGNSSARSNKKGDNSPPIKIQKQIDSTPSRKKNDGDHSPLRRKAANRDRTPTRVIKRYNVPESDVPGTSKYVIPHKRVNKSGKMQKTLDGKAAGLQNAHDLVKETEAFRKREDELFRNMTSEISGINAAPVMRDRKTGKIRDFKQEAEDKKEKERKEDENKEKYSRWGKGLKQVEDRNEKLAEDLYVTSKPLARYADDKDLEQYLKKQDREGDPMLEYIRKKRKKDAVVQGKPLKPQYEGECMPNRFGILPGHRWDGVDRSNDYEKKWFQIQNSKKAALEDTYRWSTEDM